MEASFFFKRVIRSWRLFLALLLGITLASTFFCSINLGADVIAKGILDRQLNQIPVDIVLHVDTANSTSDSTEIMKALSTSNIEGIRHIEILSRGRDYLWISKIPRSNTTTDFTVVGITEDSIVQEGLTLMSGNSSLEVNETYVWVNSVNAKDLRLGDTLFFNITLGGRYGTVPGVYMFPIPNEQSYTMSFTINLTIVGFVDLEDQALGIAAGIYGWGQQLPPYVENILVVDWEKTLAKFLDAVSEAFSTTTYRGSNTVAETDILIFLDRDSLINFWDLGSSIDNIRTIDAQIQNKVRAMFPSGATYTSNYLVSPLSNYSALSQSMTIQYVIVSLPVFFVAWYMGTTTSDVSYNLRRREIGLLLAKGFSRRQLLRMLLSESTLIGLLGGLIGVGVSVFLTPIFLGVGDFSTVTSLIHMDTLAVILPFSVGLTLLSVFQSARRASKLDIVEALQEYRYVEEVKPYSMRWPWVALILGTYKIVAWLIGFNLNTYLRGPPPGLNILLTILLGVWMFFDLFILNYVGPLLFFWGLTKILIRSSLKFQELITRLAKFTGDLGSMATRNIRRNPARAASIAFLIAMIIGYSFQIVGSFASERDYAERQARFNVGADISVQLKTLENASSTMAAIGNLSEVSFVTIEYRFTISSPLGYAMRLVAVNPDEWLHTAYYETELFTGRDTASAFGEMENDEETIILERSLAESLKLGLDEVISLTFGGGASQQIVNLRIVGFFGPKSSTQGWYEAYYSGSYWSYVPYDLYKAIKDKVTPTANILVRLRSNVDGEAVAEKIRNLQLGDISTVSSVSEVLKQQQNRWSPYTSVGPTNPFSISVTGAMDIQRLGVFFAVLAASLGTVLVTLVSLKERSREIGILGAKGLSFKQIVGILMVENLALVSFSVILGAVVGLIVAYGNISAANSTSFGYSPLLHHLVFPPDSILTLMACCALVLASTIIPVLLIVRRYLSDMERIVREV